MSCCSNNCGTGYYNQCNCKNTECGQQAQTTGDITNGVNCNETAGAVGVFFKKTDDKLEFRSIKGKGGIIVEQTISGCEICIDGSALQNNAAKDHEKIVFSLPANVWTKVPSTFTNMIVSVEFYDQFSNRISLYERHAGDGCIEVNSNIALTNVQAFIDGE